MPTKQPSFRNANHLRVAPDILVRLGEELVPHIDVGIAELARNAYDADATRCSVRLIDVTKQGGTVLVSDDGRGMTGEQIEDTWLLLGHSTKRHDRISEGGRRLVGEKGLGRLAALRFGESAILRTRSQSLPGVEFELTIDWRRFDRVTAIEEVDLDVVQRSTTSPHGTDVELIGLRSALTNRDVKRLARTLVLLSDPFHTQGGFRVELLSEEFRDLHRLVREAYFNEADYRIEGEVSPQGRVSAQILDWRDKQLSAGSHSDIAHDRGGETYDAPSFRFTLWVFTLGRRSFDVRGSTTAVSAVRTWLETVGGVQLYHRKLRVAPYGDAGVDWLNLNLRRARSPEERPSTNNSVGLVLVDDDDGDLLVAKTDRSGLIDNGAFEDLKSACGDILDWAALERVRARDARKREQRKRTESAVDLARSELTRSLTAVPTTERGRVRQAVDDYREAVAAQVSVLEDELQLYRTMSTVGTTTAVLAHEIVQPVETVEAMTKSIRTNGKRLLGERYAEGLGQQVEVLAAAGASLRTYAQLPLKLLQKSKRRPSAVDLHATIARLQTLLQPSLDAAKIMVDRDFANERLVVRASVAAIEAVLANFLVNARYVLVEHSDNPDRMIVIRTRRSGSDVVLSVFDNGPGIDSTLGADDVWLPGTTARSGGTGLGLTIVRDVVESLEGSVQAIREGELGGAEFIVTLPLESWEHRS